uniref:Secreted protein n=1 Tax=Streptomyces sp. NBC_00008 TaxID=2903610 RepID=A0AAU2W0K1_9ACTN
MTTVVIIVAVVLVVAAGLYFAFGRQPGGRGLQRRFGPEYDRTLARHDGDAKAAEHELSERLKRHRSLDERPLSPEDRARYAERWTRIQGGFVDAPQQAVAEADALLAELARDTGFPDGSDFEEQTAALSVHHAEHLGGYRRVHAVQRGAGSTEDMREAMIEARGLFDVLVSNGNGSPVRQGHHHAEGSGTA